MTDFLQTPRYQLPDDWTVSETMCVKITIPADQQYYGMLIGLLDTLKWSKNFAHDETRTGAATVSRTWQRALESAPIESEGCDMPDFRINPETCLLEVDCSGDGTDWKPVFTPDYNPTEDAPPVILYPDPPPAGESNQCLAAENVTSWMRDGTHQFALLLALDPLLGEIAAFLYGILSYLVTVVQANLWTFLLEIDFGTFDAEEIVADWEAFDWDEFKNLIVCYFSPDGSISIANHLEALDEMESHVGQIYRLIRMVWSLAGSIGISSVTRWAGIVEGDCEDCEGFWSHTWNSENGWDGWEAFESDSDYGTLIDGVWVFSNTGGSDLLVVNSPVLASEVLIDRMVWSYSIVGGSPPFGQHRINIFNDGGMNFNQAVIDWSEGGHILDDMTPHNTIYAQFDIEAPLGWVAVQLTGVTFYGQGTDPYL